MKTIERELGARSRTECVCVCVCDCKLRVKLLSVESRVLPLDPPAGRLCPPTMNLAVSDAAVAGTCATDACAVQPLRQRVNLSPLQTAVFSAVGQQVGLMSRPITDATYATDALCTDTTVTSSQNSKPT